MKKNSLSSGPMQQAFAKLSDKSGGALPIMTVRRQKTSGPKGRQFGGRKPTGREYIPDEAEEKTTIVTLKDNQKFVIIFECGSYYLPEGVQVLPSSAGDTDHHPIPPTMGTITKLEMVRLSIKHMLTMCSINVINVVAKPDGFCRVFVNCTAKKKGATGDKHWGEKTNPYGTLLRKGMGRVWQMAHIKTDENGKLYVVLKRYVPEPQNLPPPKPQSVIELVI